MEVMTWKKDKRIRENWHQLASTWDSLHPMWGFSSPSQSTRPWQFAPPQGQIVHRVQAINRYLIGCTVWVSQVAVNLLNLWIFSCKYSYYMHTQCAVWGTCIRERREDCLTADLSDSLRTAISSSSVGKRHTVYNRGSNLSPRKGLAGEFPYTYMDEKSHCNTGNTLS